MTEPPNWSAVATFAETVAGPAGETIRPADRSGLGTQEGRVIADLAAIGDRSSMSARLEILGTLGEGGMGIVRLGRQLALDREVAIKELTEERRGQERSVLKLLQEAWLAGSLEHPNIVPIYDIEVQAGGEPRIVMKRIQGQPWDELIDDADAVAARFGHDDLLQWNLEVLMQVANAVRFAHDRGIVHLDLKPSNVMLGQFGEVYLLDWGLAMSLDDRSGGRFPLASKNDEIIGTPSYIAPEMLSGEGGKLSERTDVYLLGAVLHQIVSGRPPHRGDSMLAIFFQAATRTPELGEEHPDELRSIVRRASALDPADRFEGADAVRLAIRDFLEHRGSRALSEEASERLAELREVAALPRSGDAEVVQARRDRLHRAFNEARFGFGQALAAWSDNREASAGLREALVLMVGHELDHGSPQAAATLLAEIADAPAELSARVVEALRAQGLETARIAKLERLDDDMNLKIGSRTRLFVVSILGLLWIASPIWSFFSGGEDDHYSQQYGPPAVFLATAVFLGFVGRESLGRTLVNRRLFAVIITLLLSQMLLTSVCWWHNVAPEPFATLLFFMWFMVATLTTITVERRLWPSAVAQLIGLVTVAVWPATVFFTIAAANAVFLANVLVIWRPNRFRGTYDGDARVVGGR